MAVVTLSGWMPGGLRLRDLFVQPLSNYDPSTPFQILAAFQTVNVDYSGAGFEGGDFTVAAIAFGTSSGIWLTFDSSSSPKSLSGITLEQFHRSGVEAAAALMSGTDALYGSFNGDYLEGYAGNDTLDGGSGADTMEGGAGDDVYFVDNTNDRTTETAGGGRDLVIAEVGFALAFTDEIEELRASSAASAMALTGSGTSNRIVGTAGSDTLDGAGGIDTLEGSAGDDSYIVNAPGDVLVEDAWAGHDTVLTRTDYTLAANLEVLKAIADSAAVRLSGNPLDNEIVGNSGINVIDGQDGNDRLYGDGGHDGIAGGNGTDWLFGGIGDDTLAGGAGADALYGDVGNDMLFGDDGDDSLFGGSGADRMDAGGGNDIVYGDVGNDRIFGGGGTDMIYAGHGNNLVFAGDGNDVAFGGRNTDKLSGEGGNDKLYGDSGKDVLNGGLGKDTLSGGAGTDTFVFDTKLTRPKNLDRILDFVVGSDRIRLDDAVFKGIAPRGALDPKAFHTGSFAQDGADRIIYDPANGALSYDRDGSGPIGQVRFAILKPGLTLSFADVFIV